jgi:uncharacterized MAPEG superfamily protein
MTIAYWCVLVAGLLPFAFTLVAKAAGSRYDNRDPRSWQSRLSGLPARAHAAHLNSFEALPLFAAAVIIAVQAGADGDRINALAMAFIALRVGYGVCYIADWSNLRSLLWLAALGCCVALFLIIP